MITREEFEAWRENPVTQRVFGIVGAMSAQSKAAWMAASWEQGRADPLVLADLRATARVADDLVGLAFEDIEEKA
jgi:hypothetical protein